MKTTVVVALIVIGAILIVTPVVADQLHEANVVHLLDKPGTANVHLDNHMSTEYKFGCWSTGSAMIAVSVFLTLWFSKQPASVPTGKEGNSNPV